MENILKDIIQRTNKELYIGVVGAVRTGKSTFIKRFIETKVLPFVTDDAIRNKIVDELPHSADGKTIMTMEPKFVPNNTVCVNVDEDLDFNVRLVDSVGYIINGASGHYSEEGPRMVKTPWFEDAIPFVEAAEIGTNKVINNHSNIGIVVTTDGTVTDFERENYIEVEETIINQMKEIDKPFVVVLNTLSPSDDRTIEIANKIEEKHNVSVIRCNIDSMNENDIDRILKEALQNFEINELNVKVPSWLSVLDTNNKHRLYLEKAIEDSTNEFKKMKDVYRIVDNFKQYDNFDTVRLENVDSSTGSIDIHIECDEAIYQEVLNEILGENIDTRGKFIELLQDMKNAKREYDQIKDALNMVKETGYGVSVPVIDSMTLEEPEIIKQGSRYGVKLKAIAPSIHMVKVDVESTFEPIIGSREQSKDLIDNLFKDKEKNVWESEIFGRKLSELVNDGIRSKLFLLPDNAKNKFQKTLQKVVNEGKGSLITIML